MRMLFGGRFSRARAYGGYPAEAATYDETFQSYRQIMMMDVEGRNNLWEGSMPLFLPNEVFKGAACKKGAEILMLCIRWTAAL